jgi:hypothetical protein
MNIKMIFSKKIKVIFLFIAITFSGFSQTTISELTMVFDITVESKTDKPQIANMFNGATQTVYIKGLNHRTDEVNSLGTSSTIYDGKTKSAIVLKEYGAQKILVKMNALNWIEYNKKYENITFTKETETKVIAGYNATKYTGKMKDGTEFIVYCTTEINPETNLYKNNQFSKTEGLVLQYQFSVSGTKVTNIVSKVIIGNVDAAKFAIPKSGYREMTYEESKAK